METRRCKCEIKTIDGDVAVVAAGVIVFRRKKSPQTVAIANSLYFAYKYPDRPDRPKVQNDG